MNTARQPETPLVAAAVTAPARRRRRGPALVVTVAIVFAAAVAATVVFATWTPAGTTIDLGGHRVALDPGDLPDAHDRARQDAADSGQGRFEIPSVGLNVPLGALNEVDGVITPPGFTSVYLVRNRGVDTAHAATGTVFVVTHSLRGGGKAPGNYLIDVRHGTAAVADGATVIVDGVHYTVDDSGAVDKPRLADDAAVWANTPDRLVIITCLQVPAGTASVDNLVITATRRP
ncbi:MAG TPA: class F sortase [Gryllotalpicola sp.]